MSIINLIKKNVEIVLHKIAIKLSISEYMRFMRAQKERGWMAESKLDQFIYAIMNTNLPSLAISFD